MSWTVCDTAVDFHARLRFPRAAAESPRRLGSWGSHLFRFSRRSLRLALQSTARSNETDEPTFTITKTNHESNMLINGSFFIC